MSEMTDAQKHEYMQLSHAIQSGVMLEQSRGSQDGSPKHLRVGVNLAHVSHSALANLLIEKGVITAEEYFEVLLIAMRDEVLRYEERNKPIKFR